MAITQLNSYLDVQRFIDKILDDNKEQDDIPSSPHKAFWRSLKYEDFVNGNMPGVSDPDTGQPMPILVKGNSAQSNLIQSLRGTGKFGTGGSIRRMPADGPPYFTPDQISSIAAWIDKGCPNPLLARIWGFLTSLF